MDPLVRGEWMKVENGIPLACRMRGVRVNVVYHFGASMGEKGVDFMKTGTMGAR